MCSAVGRLGGSVQRWVGWGEIRSAVVYVWVLAGR